MTNEEFKKAMTQTYKFNKIANAESFRDRAKKAMAILMGDDGKYWVTTLAVAEKLGRAGYEFAN